MMTMIARLTAHARRRDVLLGVSGAVGLAGLIASAPAQADDAIFAIDLTKIPVGSVIRLFWQKQPIFVRHLAEAEIQAAQSVSLADLRDPQTLEDRTKPGHRDWLVTIGICPHLGCTPLGVGATEPRGRFGGYVCPCHGSMFDTAGRVRAGPSPTNLEVPPYSFRDRTTLILGGGSAERSSS